MVFTMGYCRESGVVQVENILFSQHALDQMAKRGTTRTEVEVAIREGEVAPAKKGRLAFRKNFPFNSEWKGKYYDMKQVMAIAVKEEEQFVVITVYAFYFGGGE
jgi:hypothetical protein